MDHQAELKNVILQKATELFMFQGYSTTTIRQIAEAAQIGRGNIHELLNNVLSKELDPLEKYALTVHAFIHMITEDEHIFRIYIQASRIDVLRSEYVQIMNDFFSQWVGSSSDWSEEELYLSSVMSVSGEFELLNQFSMDALAYPLDVLISSIIKTKLLLLRVSIDTVDDMIAAASIEFQKLQEQGHLHNIPLYPM